MFDLCGIPSLVLLVLIDNALRVVGDAEPPFWRFGVTSLSAIGSEPRMRAAALWLALPSGSNTIVPYLRSFCSLRMPWINTN